MLQLACPPAPKKVYVNFSDIADAGLKLKVKEPLGATSLPEVAMARVAFLLVHVSVTDEPYGMLVVLFALRVQMGALGAAPAATSDSQIPRRLKKDVVETLAAPL